MTPVSVLDRILVDTTTIYPGHTEPARFWLAPLSVRERNRMYGLLADGGAYPTDDELREAARAVIPTVFPDQAEALLALCDALDAHDDTECPEDADGKAAYQKAGARLARQFNTRIHNPLTRTDCAPYKALLARKREWVVLLSFLRVQFTLRGWERGPVEFATEALPPDRGFRTGPVIATADVVDRLSEADFDLLETAAKGLSEVSKAERGN